MFIYLLLLLLLLSLRVLTLAITCSHLTYTHTCASQVRLSHTHRVSMLEFIGCSVGKAACPVRAGALVCTYMYVRYVTLCWFCDSADHGYVRRVNVARKLASFICNPCNFDRRPRIVT